MCKMGTNNIEKRKREQEMMKLKRTGLGLLLLAGLLCLQTGCSASGTGQNEEKQSDENTQDRNETGNNENPEEPDPVIEEYERDTTPGSRTAVTLEEATKKKNNGEQFILLFTKDDCSYCAAFDEVLNRPRLSICWIILRRTTVRMVWIPGCRYANWMRRRNRFREGKTADQQNKETCILSEI